MIEPLSQVIKKSSLESGNVQSLTEFLNWISIKLKCDLMI